MKNNNIKIKFKVKNVIYRKVNEEKARAILDTDIIEYPEGLKIPTAVHTIINNSYYGDIDKGDIFEASGKWGFNSRYGKQFITDSIVLSIPEGVDATEKFLVKKVKGVGKKTAEKLTEEFGVDLLYLITYKPEEIKKAKSVSETMINRLLDNKSLKIIKVFNDTKRELYYLPYTDILKLIEEFGNFASSVVKTKPYSAIRALNFEQCEMIAKRNDFGAIEKERIKQGILEVLKLEVMNGHSYEDKDKILKKTERFLNNTGYFKSIRIEEEYFEEIIEELRDEEKIVEDKGKIYPKFYYDIEVKTARMIRNRIKKKEKEKEKEVRKYLKKRKEKGLEIEDEQEDAVVKAINSHISILTGGPGTGKTYTSAIIIDTIREIDKGATIQLAAPTGKAAKRMTELSGMESSTIHRLLGIYEEETLSFNEINADYLIIDESSMIDGYLFYAILSAISDKTKVLLIGDHNQLPPIGVGLVLRDLIESNKIETANLQTIHRQAKESQIIEGAYNILNKKEEIPSDNSKGDFYFIEQEKEEMVVKTIKASIDRLLTTGFKLDDIQVATPMNKGQAGVDNLNTIIQKRYNKNTKSIEIGKRFLKLNDRVIHTENNKDLGVYNGETGKIIRIDNGQAREIEVNFGDKKVIYNGENLYQLNLAYALTVHKCQGSEFEVVIMPMILEHEFMLSNSILYTALTRAEERVIFIGQKRQYKKAINNNKNIIRRSKLKERIEKE